MPSNFSPKTTSAPMRFKASTTLDAAQRRKGRGSFRRFNSNTRPCHIHFIFESSFHLTFIILSWFIRVYPPGLSSQSGTIRQRAGNSNNSAESDHVSNDTSLEKKATNEMRAVDQGIAKRQSGNTSLTKFCPAMTACFVWVLRGLEVSAEWRFFFNVSISPAYHEPSLRSNLQG